MVGVHTARVLASSGNDNRKCSDLLREVVIKFANAGINSEMLVQLCTGVRDLIRDASDGEAKAKLCLNGILEAHATFITAVNFINTMYRDVRDYPLANWYQMFSAFDDKVARQERPLSAVLGRARSTLHLRNQIMQHQPIVIMGKKLSAVAEIDALVAEVKSGELHANHVSVPHGRDDTYRSVPYLRVDAFMRSGPGRAFYLARADADAAFAMPQQFEMPAPQ